MRATCFLAAALIFAGPASAAPAEMQASRSKMLAAMPPAARDWIAQEARREIAADGVSVAAAMAAANNSGVNFGSIPIEDAVILMMMALADDADSDLRQMLSEMQAANRQKQALRNAAAQEKSAQAALNEKMRQEYNAAQVHERLALSPALRAYMASRNVSQDSLGDISQEQQLKMQMLMDDITKADEAASNAEKKFTATADAIVPNWK